MPRVWHDGVLYYNLILVTLVTVVPIGKVWSDTKGYCGWWQIVHTDFFLYIYIDIYIYVFSFCPWHFFSLMSGKQSNMLYRKITEWFYSISALHCYLWMYEKAFIATFYIKTFFVWSTSWILVSSNIGQIYIFESLVVILNHHRFVKCSSLLTIIHTVISSICNAYFH